MVKRGSAAPFEEQKEQKQSKKKSSLLDTLSLLSPGLADESKAGVKPQECAFSFLDGGVESRIVTFNGEIAVSTPAPERLRMLVNKAVPGKPLLQLLERLSGEDEDIATTLDKNEIQFESGKTRAGVPLLDLLEETKDHSEQATKWLKLPRSFSSALRFCMYACGKDMSVPALTCVHIRPEDGIIEATDNHRASHYNIEPFAAKISTLIPAASVKETSGIDYEKIALTDGWVHLKTKDDTVVSIRTFDVKYLDIDSAGIFKKPKSSVQISLPDDLDSVLDRASIFSARDYFLDERITIKLLKGRMKIRAEGHQGWLEETLRMKYDAEDTEFDINPKFLKEILEHTRDCYLLERRLLFNGDNWDHVVTLPVKKD